MTHTGECEQSEANAIIQDFFCSSAVEVLQHYGPGAIAANPTILPTRRMNASAISLGNDRMHVRSVLMLDQDSLSHLPGVQAFDPLDWLGELNNQLIGRLKNKLLRSGVPSDVTTPVNHANQNLDDYAFNGETQFFRVSWQGYEMVAAIDSRLPNDLELSSFENADVADEGSIELF